jgi:hypothetical protein
MPGAPPRHPAVRRTFHHHKSLHQAAPPDARKGHDFAHELSGMRRKRAGLRPVLRLGERDLPGVRRISGWFRHVAALDCELAKGQGVADQEPDTQGGAIAVPYVRGLRAHTGISITNPLDFLRRIAWSSLGYASQLAF